VKRTVGGVVLAGLALTLLAAASGQAAGSAAPAAAGSTEVPAVDDLATCLSAQGRGDVLVLMDESQSLRSTDPQSARVNAANFLLERLAVAADQRHWNLSVSVDGFSAGLDPVIGWSRLTTKTAPSFTGRVNQFRQRTDGVDTDYWNALDGVRQELRKRARNQKSVETQPCQAVVWITDGEFSIQPRTTASLQKRYGVRKSFAPGIKITSAVAAERAQQAGIASICRTGGLADQLHSTGVHTLAIGLEADQGTGRFGLLRAVSTGSSSSFGRCGSAATPSNGYFATATGLDDLLFVIDQVGNGSAQITHQVVCQRKPCPEGTRTFVLDNSVQRVRLLAGASVDGITVQLRPPDGGRPLLLSAAGGKNGSGTVVGVPVTWTWLSPRTVSADFSKVADKAWAGAWSIVFVDPKGASRGAKTRSVLRIEGDLVPAVLNQSALSLRSHQLVPGLKIGVVRAGTTDPVTPLGTATMDATLTHPPDKPVSVFTGLKLTSPTVNRELDLTKVSPGKAVLRLRLAVTTAPAGTPHGQVAGTRLDDRFVDVPLTILPPAGNYPQIAASIDFGLANGTTRLTSTLPVSGAGCVWLRSVAVGAAPDGTSATVDAAGADSPAHCRRLDTAGGTGLPLQLRLSRKATGTTSGTLQIGSTPAGGGETVWTPVSFSADSVLPPNNLERWTVLFALLGFGILIPVGIAFGLAWWAARIPRVPLRVALIPVRVEGERVLRDGLPFWVTNEDLSWVTVAPGQSRRLDLPFAGLRIESKKELHLGRGLAFVVKAPQAHTLAVSSRPPGRFGRTHWEAVLPQTVHNRWAVVVPDDGSGEISVLVLFDNRADERVWQRLGSEVGSRLPGLLRRSGVISPGTGPGTGTDPRTGSSGSSGSWLSGAGQQSSAGSANWFSQSETGATDSEEKGTHG
jgi:hypothetical protein